MFGGFRIFDKVKIALTIRVSKSSLYHRFIRHFYTLNIFCKNKLKKFLVVWILFFILLFGNTAKAEVPKLFNHLAKDLSYTFLSYPALLLIGGGIAAGGFAQIDENIHGHFKNGSIFGKPSTILNQFGEMYVVDSSAALLWVIAEMAGSKKLALTGETLVEALFWTETTTLGLKLISHRTRPDGEKYSFPSGHTSRAFAVATALETMHGPLIGIPAFLLAGCAGFARIEKNKHFLSDVVFGAAWGSAIGWGVATFHKNNKPSEEKVTIIPSIGSGPGLTVGYWF